MYSLLTPLYFIHLPGKTTFFSSISKIGKRKIRKIRISADESFSWKGTLCAMTHTEIPIKKAFLLGLPRTATAATVKQSTPWFCLVPSSLLRKEKCTLDHSSRTPIFGHTSCSFFFKKRSESHYFHYSP